MVSRGIFPSPDNSERIQNYPRSHMGIQNHSGKSGVVCQMVTFDKCSDYAHVMVNGVEVGIFFLGKFPAVQKQEFVSGRNERDR